MPVLYNPYELHDGYIHNWLVAGPVVETVDQPCDALERWIKQNYSSIPQIKGRPVEQGPLTEGLYTVAGQQGAWRYYRCQEDHFLDHSSMFPTCRVVHSWAYTELISPTAQATAFVLITWGLADVWINGENVCCVGQFNAGSASVPFKADLNEGKNELLVRYVGVAAPRCILAMALRVLTGGIRVQIPTLIPSLDRRNELEEINEKVYFDRDVYAAGQNIYLCWPGGYEKPSYQDVRLQTLQGRIYAQAEDVGQANYRLALNNSSALDEGSYKVFIMPRAWEYYDSQIRVTKELDCWVTGRNRFSDKPYGTLEERRKESLLYAATQENNLFAEIAKIALDRWKGLDTEVIVQAIEEIHQRRENSEILMLGLMGLLRRFGNRSKFPRLLRRLIKDCILNFRYWQDEPGSDVLSFHSESRQIIFHTCEILAGQLYPDQVFGNSGMTGEQHHQKGETLALEWMRTRCHSGFKDWDSREGYAQILMALSHLVDLAKAEPVWELGSVLMDKLFFSIALNSYKGVFGSSQGKATMVGLRSGLMDSISGITRLMWGMGVYNSHIAETVSLACLKKYELPPIIADIASYLAGEIWNKEQQGIGQMVNKVTYRTPDYMLSSAQDYHPGEPGEREHIWQATLGPQTVVFVTHPGCSSESDAHVPNFWLGNGVLPRVAQWKDALIALYKLPDDAWMRYTHAYFPTYEFDEYVIRDHTAFGRKGDGYIALTASQGLELVVEGRTAYRELRSYGQYNGWVCQMGRAVIDGGFTDFQARVLANSASFDPLKIKYQTTHGDTLTFGWEEPLVCNGEELALSAYQHFENPFASVELPCERMEIHVGEYLLRLDFGELP